MTKCKNARPTAATVGQASGNATSNLRIHFTLPKDGGQSEISDYLHTGQEHSVSLRQLRQWTGLDERTIRQRITAERLKGVPILADNQTGYFLPASEEERNRCVQSMRHRAKEIYKTAQAIEAADIQTGLEEGTAADGRFDGTAGR